MSGSGTAPFSPGEIVMINGFTHLGLQRVVACEWGTPPGSEVGCWMCECRDAGRLGTEAGGSPAWRGPAAYLSRHAS